LHLLRFSFFFSPFYHFFCFPHFCNSVSLLVQFFIFQKDFFLFFPKKNKKTKEEISLCNWCDHFWWRSVVFERSSSSSSISWSPHHFFFAFFQIFIFMVPIVLGQGHLSEYHSFIVTV
jgi:hypothetical protein